MADYKRFTAKKTNIKELLNGDFKEDKNLLVSRSNEKIKRVRLMATVINKFLSDDGKYGFLVLDDSTETIRTKAFREDVKRIKRIEEGDIIDLIGRLDKYEDEIYIRPEIVKKVEDPNWLLVRKLELHLQGKGKEDIGSKGEEVGEPNGEVKREGKKHSEKGKALNEFSGEENKQGKEEEVIVEEVKNSEETIYDFLKDEGKANFDELIKELDIGEEEAKECLKNLMQEGKVFEPRKKVYKALN